MLYFWGFEQGRLVPLLAPSLLWTISTRAPRILRRLPRTRYPYGNYVERCRSHGRSFTFNRYTVNTFSISNNVEHYTLKSLYNIFIAGNESCPQPQTSEHLAAIEIMKLKHIVILQNKIDLVKEAQAKEQYEQILKFVQGTLALFFD